MGLTFQAISALCPTAQTGTTSQQKATVTPLQVRLVIEPETIQAVPITMEQVTPFILVHAEDNTTLTVMGTELMYQKGTYGSN